MEIVTQYIQQGKEYQRGKRFELAIDEFTKAIEIDEHNLEAYYWRGFCFYQINDAINALADFQTTIDLKPDYAKAYYWRALTYIDLDEDDLALEDLNQAINLNPQDVISYYRRAEILSIQEDFEKAQQDLEKAIHLSPKYVDALLLMSQIKYKLGDNQGVLEHLDKLIEIKDDYPEAYQWRALAKLRLKDFEDSVADLEKAAQIYQLVGNQQKYAEIEELITSVNREIELLNNHISIKTLDSLNLEKQRKNLDELIQKENPIVYHFDRDMIKTYLKKNNIPYLQDKEGDIVLRCDYDEHIDCELTVYLMASGKKKSTYSISIRSNKRIDQKYWNDALILCNRWNLESRWPTASLFVRNKEDKYGLIFLEYYLDLEAGIHQQLLDNITSHVISAAYNFWYSTKKYFL